MNFSQARKNMVECQIHTAGITREAILRAFETIPRERFVPDHLQGIAYADSQLSPEKGRFMLEPSVLARMIQAAQPEAGEKILDIGGLSGYSAAVMARLGAHVVALDENEAAMQKARNLWTALDLHNISGVSGPMGQGCPAHSPYDLIFINGMIEAVPATLAAQLAPGGRAVAVAGKAGRRMGQVMIYKKTGENHMASHPLFEAAGHFLPGFEPEAAFSF